MLRVSITSLALAATTLALAAAVVPATAADIYAPPPAAPYNGYAAVQAPGPNWNGAYVGAQAGYAWGNTRIKMTPPGASGKDQLDGAIGGIYGGVNTQLGANFVVGAEADINASGQSVRSTIGKNDFRTQSDWNGTVRARVGVAYDRVMPYATAGIGFVDANVRRNANTTQSDTRVGLAAGAGIEGQITPNLVAKGEYMYIHGGSTDYTFGGKTVKSEVNPSMLRAGVGYKF